MAQTVRAHAMPHTRSRDRVAPMFVQVYALLGDKFACEESLWNHLPMKYHAKDELIQLHGNF